MDIAAARRLQESYVTIFGPIVARGADDPDLDPEGPQGQILARLADALFDVERLRVDIARGCGGDAGVAFSFFRGVRRIQRLTVARAIATFKSSAGI